MSTVDENHKIYTDQTVKFPITSSCGNKYILIMYVYDANTIREAPIKSRFDINILESYTKKIEHLTNRGYRPRSHCLDNEASDSLENISNKNMPPHIHHVNASDWDISTWKDHFIAGMPITDTHFPINLWFWIIPQATMNLNMFGNFRQNTTMSAHTAIEWQFDFNKTPLEPPGIKVIVY